MPIFIPVQCPACGRGTYSLMKPFTAKLSKEVNTDQPSVQKEYWDSGHGAAGCIFVAKDTGRILLAHRNAEEDPQMGYVEEPDSWATWGGKIDDGESPKDAVVREVEEETGYAGDYKLAFLWTYKDPNEGFQYHNFLAIVDTEFLPKRSWENDRGKWVEFGEWPSPMHFGLKALIQHAGEKIQRVIILIKRKKASLLERRMVRKKMPRVITEMIESQDTHQSVIFPKGLVGDGIWEYELRSLKSYLRYRHEPDTKIFYLDNVGTPNEQDKNKGYAKALLETFFQLIKGQGGALDSGPYTTSGTSYVKHVVERLSKQYGVRLVTGQDEIAESIVSESKLDFSVQGKNIPPEEVKKAVKLLYRFFKERNTLSWLVSHKWFLKSVKTGHTWIDGERYEFEYVPKKGRESERKPFPEAEYTRKMKAFRTPKDAVDYMTANEKKYKGKYAFRGMNMAEWVDAQKQGYIKSEGDYNLGGVDQTYFGSNWSTAHSYAGGFAPFDKEPTRSLPGVIVAVPFELTQDAKATTGMGSEGERVAEKIPLGQVKGLWYIVPTEVGKGSMELVLKDGNLDRGSASPPPARFVIVPKDGIAKGGREINEAVIQEGLYEYFYHATTPEALPGIVAHGLVPSKGDTHWGGDLGKYSEGKIFVTKSFRSALYYGNIIWRDRPNRYRPVLRFKYNKLKFVPDKQTTDDFYVEYPIKARFEIFVYDENTKFKDVGNHGDIFFKESTGEWRPLTKDLADGIISGEWDGDEIEDDDLSEVYGDKGDHVVFGGVFYPDRVVANIFKNHNDYFGHTHEHGPTRWVYYQGIRTVFWHKYPPAIPEWEMVVKEWLEKRGYKVDKQTDKEDYYKIMQWYHKKGLLKETLLMEAITDEQAKAAVGFLKKMVAEGPFKGQVHLAGGPVRDMIMGKTPKDLDLSIVSNTIWGALKFTSWLANQMGNYKGPSGPPPTFAKHIKVDDYGCPKFSPVHNDPTIIDAIEAYDNYYAQYSNPVIFPKFGTAKLNLTGTFNGASLDGVEVEAVSARKEIYEPGNRKPIQVLPGTLRDDALRRDFRANSLLMDLTTDNIFDVTGKGIEDIKNRVLITTSDPEVIFKEDPLRMMRAVRFMVQKGFNISPETEANIKKNASWLKFISRERVRDEIDKILVTKDPGAAFRKMNELGLLQYVAPEFQQMIGMTQNVHHEHDVFDHTMAVLAKTQPELVRRRIALFHDIGKLVTREVTPTGVHFIGHEMEGPSVAEKIMMNLKYPKMDIDAVKLGITHHMKLKHGGDDAVKLSDKSLRKFKIAVGQYLEHVLDVIHADNTAHASASAMPNQIVAVRKRLDTLDIKEVDKPTLPITGNDLIAIGIKPGPVIGKMLSAVTDAWYENPKITRDEAMAIAQRIV